MAATIDDQLPEWVQALERDPANVEFPIFVAAIHEGNQTDCQLTRWLGDGVWAAETIDGQLVEIESSDLLAEVRM